LLCALWNDVFKSMQELLQMHRRELQCAEADWEGVHGPQVCLDNIHWPSQPRPARKGRWSHSRRRRLLFWSYREPTWWHVTSVKWHPSVERREPGLTLLSFGLQFVFSSVWIIELHYWFFWAVFQPANYCSTWLIRRQLFFLQELTRCFGATYVGGYLAFRIVWDVHVLFHWCFEWKICHIPCSRNMNASFPSTIVLFKW
jgi:hypothetical protein